MLKDRNTQNSIQGRSFGALLYGVFSFLSIVLGMTLLFVVAEYGVLALSKYDSKKITTNSIHSIDFLHNAQKSMEMMQWEDACYDAKKYLEHNPDDYSRWTAWNIIVDALRNNEKYEEALSILDDMYYEYVGQSAFEQAIALQKAPMLALLRRYDDAISVYTMLENKHDASAPDSPYHFSPEQHALIQYRLAQLFIRDHNSMAAEEKLRACIRLDALPLELRIQCAYDLAKLEAAHDKEYEAQERLQKLWAIKDIPRALRAKIGFLLADILERREKKSQARAMFETLRDIYPNKAVIDMRLKLLK